MTYIKLYLKNSFTPSNWDKYVSKCLVDLVRDLIEAKVNSSKDITKAVKQEMDKANLYHHERVLAVERAIKYMNDTGDFRRKMDREISYFLTRMRGRI